MGIGNSSIPLSVKTQQEAIAPTNAKSSDGGPDSGAIAGGVIGAILCLIIIVIILLIVRRKIQKKEREKSVRVEYFYYSCSIFIVH